MSEKNEETPKRMFRDDAYGVVCMKDPFLTHVAIWVNSARGYLEVIQQEEFGITKLSDSSWGIRIYSKDTEDELYIPGCQIRVVQVLDPAKIDECHDAIFEIG